MRKLIVEVASDISQLLKGLHDGEAATQRFAKEVSVDSATMARAQVDAAIKTTAALEKEAAAYRAIANVAEKGSKEQATAARLAANAEQKLAASIAHTGREASSTAAKAHQLERATGHAARGALSGSGLFQTFGRSLAFASGGFIAFHEASEFIRESVDAAREAVVSQRSLAAQMKASGESFDANRERIEKVALSYGKFGFQNDEVIASLTVLERGTGNINKAMALQGLAADLARAKNLELAGAANVIAKVFGGQETALRRAVPGLQKNAHGMDLIRLAQAKLAGQAAANTTAAERFHAILHDTEEIVGTALLPTLNKYLNQLSRWLERMNRSGKLQKDVAQTARLLADAVAAVKAVTEPLVAAFQALADILGGNKRALEALLGVYLSWKALKIADSVQKTITSFFQLGKAAEGQVGKIAKLRGALLRLVANPYTVAIVVTFIGAEYVAKKIKDLQKMVLDAQTQTFKKGSNLETILVPNLAKQIEALKKAGVSSKDILTKLRQQLGGSLKADDLIAEAFAFSSGADPKMQARIRAQVAKRAKEAISTVKDELDKQAQRATVEQRNTWFDQLIDRLLGGVSDTPTGAPAALGVQLTRLRGVAAQLTKQIAATHDVTRLLHLKGRLQEVLNEEWQTQQEINQKTADAAEAAQEKAKEAFDKMIAARAARQFRALGLGPGGEDLIPGVGNLRKRLQSLRASLAGTSLDTRATQQMIRHIGTVLSGAFGAVGEQVRSKIDEIFKGWADELKKGRDNLETSFRPVDANKFIAGLGLGLTPDQVRRLRAGIVTLGPHATAPTQHTGAFALAGGVTINGGMHLHGVQDMSRFEAELQKRAHGRPHPRRGAR
jgi:hypothetical protein